MTGLSTLSKFENSLARNGSCCLAIPYAERAPNCGVTQGRHAKQISGSEGDQKEIDNLFRISYAPFAQESRGRARQLARFYVLLTRQRVRGTKCRTAEL